MSRIGKKIIEIPDKVEVIIANGVVTTKGPKGELTAPMPESISYTMEDNTLSFSRDSEEKHVRSIHGLTRSLVANNIEGVTNGFTTSLSVEGVGYRMEVKGKNLLMTVGYSHPVVFVPPTGVEFECPNPTTILVKGMDKQLVGQVAAKIRKVRPPEPYKGKGIRYTGEQIRRKAGKSGAK